jgi:thioredoxin reductase (NADPH)
MTQPTARCLVVGAGPAGISAALWLRDLEVPFDWIDNDALPGGTLTRVGNPLRQVIGGPWRNGTELVGELRRQLATLALSPQSGVELVAIEPTDDALCAHLSDGAAWEYPHVILCTGTRPRALGLEHEGERLGRGVEISVTRNVSRYRGRDVVVVGGGDAALEGALLLAGANCAVTLVHRTGHLRGQPRFVERVLAEPRIRVRYDRTIGEIVPGAEGWLDAVVLDDGERIVADGLFVRIGVEANAPAGLTAQCIDARGYLVVDEDGATPLPGLWAAGDVASPVHQSVSSAMGSAARAACAVERALRD